MKSFANALLILASISVASQAQAAHKHRRPAANSAAYDLTAAKPLEEVFRHFDQSQKKLKNSRARALRQAYEQLEAKQYGKARSFAEIALDSQFSDYAHWMIASASQAEAESLADNDKLKEAAAAAKTAFQHYVSVLNGNPYSPLWKQAPKQLGEAQLLIGYGLSPARESVRQFEEAFERLQVNNGGVGSVQPEETEAFAQACAKHSDDLCLPWIMRLTEHMARDSDEFKSIAALFPPISDRQKALSASHATQTYHSPDLDFAAFDDAMSAYTSQKSAEAEGKFQKFLDEFPRSTFRFRARYWLGRILGERNKKDEAKKNLEALQQDTPFSYYGLLASIATRSPMDKPVSDTSPLAAERDPAMNGPETFHLKRAEILITEKANDLAGMELKELKPRAALSSPFVMYLAGLNYRAQNYPMLFTLLTELFQRSYDGLSSETVLKMIFPVVQMERIKRYSIENMINPILVLSLIKQESAFDTHALSGSGASGLMQIMYFTAVETIPGISRTDLLEPEHNIRTGTRYLAKMLTRYHGNIVLSLAAYNAGPIAVDRWVKEGVRQKLGMLEFIESIPYRETRDYVSSIIRNYFWYSNLLATPMPTSLGFFWAPYGDLSNEIGGPDLPQPLPVPSPTPTPTADHSKSSQS